MRLWQLMTLSVITLLVLVLFAWLAFESFGIES
jgi:hypothetical protein